MVGVLLPSRLGVFDGVPVDRWPEFALLLLLVPFVLSRGLRRDVTGRLRRRGSIGLGCALALAVVVKLVLLAAGPNPGFESCYRSTVAEPVAGDCEVSFADPFRLSGATRVDRELVFGLRVGDTPAAALGGRILLRAGALTQTNWNLSFFNHNRFNFIHSDPEAVDRDRLPFTLRSRGEVDIPESGLLRLTYVGEGAITVGSRTYPLPPSYDQVRTGTLRVSPGRQLLDLRFEFRKVRRYGDLGQPTTNYATLIVDEPDGTAVEVAKPATAWRVLAGFTTVVLAATGIALVLFAAYSLLSYWWVAALLAPLALFARGVDSPHEIGPLGIFPASAAYTLALGVLLVVLVARPGPRPLFLAWLVVAGLATLRTFDEFVFADTVLYANGGDDPLTYQSQASQILATWSPQGEEDQFFYQPGYRYVLFAGRLLFGPFEPFLSTVGLAGMGMAIFFLIRSLGLMGRDSWGLRVLAMAIGALMLGVVESDVIAVNLRVLNSEWVTWILFPFAIGLLFGGRGPGPWTAGAALLGLEAFVRVNQLPLVLAVAGVFLLSLPKGRLRTGLACCAAALPLLLFPVVHNAVYGGAFVPFTTNASTSAPLGIQPEQLLDLPSDSAVRERVTDQLARALYFRPTIVDEVRMDERVPDVRFYVRGLELLWLGVVGFAAIARRRLATAALVLLALPLVAVLPYAVYDLVVYYPRHAVIGWLALGASALYALSPLARLPEEMPLRQRARAALAGLPGLQGWRRREAAT